MAAVAFPYPYRNFVVYVDGTEPGAVRWLTLAGTLSDRIDDAREFDCERQANRVALSLGPQAVYGYAPRARA